MNRRLVPAPVAVIVALFAGGCIVPVPVTQTLDARPRAAKIGSTRDEILRTSGPPNASTPDGRYCFYRFHRERGIKIVGVTPYGAGSNKLTGFHRGRLLIEFDDEGYVKDKRLHKCKKNKPVPACDWRASGVAAENEMWSMIEAHLGADAAAYRSEIENLLEPITRLHASVEAGDIRRVEELLVAGVDANAPRSGRSPLSRAASGGNADLVQLMIKYGGDVDARDFDNETPLHEASRTGALEIAQVLIENGAWVNARNNVGRTPLHNAVSAEDEPMIALLIEHGAAHIGDYFGLRPVDLMIRSDSDLDPFPESCVARPASAPTPATDLSECVTPELDSDI